MRRLVAIAALLFPSVASAQTKGITAAEVVSRIAQKSGVKLPANTVDTFKAGDPQAEVKGIAVTMMATLDVLKRAAAEGDNFIITHEPTFYSHRDTLGILESESDSVLAVKQQFIRDHRLVIWRFHDTPHSMKPDMINSGIVNALGWQGMRRTGSDVTFDLQPVSVRALGEMVGRKLGAKAVRISGDPNARVSSVVLTQGFPGFVMNRHAIQSARPDVVIIGEDHEWEAIEYVVDGISEGRIKALIVLGHIPSEQAGMEEFTKWLRGFVTEAPIHFVATVDPFRPLK